MFDFPRMRSVLVTRSVSLKQLCERSHYGFTKLVRKGCHLSHAMRTANLSWDSQTRLGAAENTERSQEHWVRQHVGVWELPHENRIVVHATLRRRPVVITFTSGHMNGQMWINSFEKRAIHSQRIREILNSVRPSDEGILKPVQTNVPESTIAA